MELARQDDEHKMKAKCRRPGNHLFGHGATGQGGALGVSGTGFAESDWEWFVYPIGHPPARHGRRAPNQYNLAAGNPSAIPIKRHDWGLDLSGSLRGAGGVGGLIRTRFSDVNYLLVETITRLRRNEQ